MTPLKDEVQSNDAASAARVDQKLEAFVVPVSNVDRAKQFYGNLGWRLDADFPFDNGFRVIQFTPPGSECSVQFGTNMTQAAPGSAQGSYLIVSDIQAARDQLAARGVEISEVFHPGTPGARIPTRREERSAQRARTEPRQLRFLRHVQRPGRQRVAVAGGHDPDTRSHRLRGDDFRVGERSSERTSACSGGPRRAREAHRRAARRELAGLVRRVHGARGGRRAPASVSNST